MVLLKNDNATLPLDPTKKTAVIGPLGNDPHDMLGPWCGQGKDSDAVSVFDGVKAESPGATFTQACTVSNDEPRRTTLPTTARPATASPMRSRQPTRPTRSCSRWERRGR